MARFVDKLPEKATRGRAGTSRHVQLFAELEAQPFRWAEVTKAEYQAVEGHRRRSGLPFELAQRSKRFYVRFASAAGRDWFGCSACDFVTGSNDDALSSHTFGSHHRAPRTVERTPLDDDEAAARFEIRWGGNP